MLMDIRFVEDGDLFGATVSRIRISIEVNKFVYKFLRVSVSEYLRVISMLWTDVKMCINVDSYLLFSVTISDQWIFELTKIEIEIQF